MNKLIEPTSRYHPIAQLFHWATAIGIVGLMTLGFVMHDLPFSPEKLKFYSWHKWAGVTVFALTWLRLAWRVRHAPPPLPAGTSELTHRASAAGHAALYVLLLAIPLSGWLMSSAKGVQTVWFGVLPIPDLLTKDVALGATLERAHVVLNYLLIFLVSGHVLAALKHHFIDRDGLLRRMAVILLVFTTAFSAATAHAVDYHAFDASKSRLGFAYKQMGVAMQGRFKNVTGQLGFDPARPAQARAAFEVDLTSIDTGTEADQEIQGKAWFNSAAFPKATFVLQQLQPTGERQYEATGRLSIKGRSVDVKVPLTVQPQGNTALLKGEFVIRRGDFAIGEGSWSKFDVVANDVRIDFQFSLKSN